MNGKVFPSDHPFWQTSYPPVFQGRFEYGCRCQVYTLSQRDIDREGLTVEQPPELGDRLPWTDEDGNSGTVTLPTQPGPGRAPGRTTAEERAQILEQITQGLDPAIAAQVIQAVEAIPLPVAAPIQVPVVLDPETYEGFYEQDYLEVGANFSDLLMFGVEGSSIDDEPPSVLVSFTVNGGFSVGSIGDPKEALKMGLKIKRSLASMVGKLSDGVLVSNTPHTSDGKGGDRAAIYEKFGFGPRDKTGTQWGVISRGRILPVSIERVRESRGAGQIIPLNKKEIEAIKNGSN
jgi:hypothetical protein